MPERTHSFCLPARATLLFLAVVLVVLAGAVVGCSGNGSEASEAGSWVHAELVDVQTGESFTIADFEGSAVLVESFAVWCPTCRSQLLEMRELQRQRDDVVLVALDTDPNEEAQQVREHIKRNDFVGRFAIAPQEMTDALHDQFGPEIVSVPTAPVVLLSADQTSARLLERGVKDADELAAAIDSLYQAAYVAVDVLLNLGQSFVLGVLTPTTALCVIPLYPAFLVGLARQVRGGCDHGRHFRLLSGVRVPRVRLIRERCLACERR